MKHDIRFSGTQSFTQSDLIRALGHSDKHDVHDADPANQKGDTGNARQQDGKNIRDRVGDVQNIFLVGEGKVIGLSGRQPVSFTQHLFSFINCQIDRLGVLCLHNDVLNRIGHSPADDSQLHGGDGHVSLHIRVVKLIATLGFGHTDHTVREVVDANHVSHHTAASSKQLFCQIRTDHNHSSSCVHLRRAQILTFIQFHACHVGIFSIASKNRRLSAGIAQGKRSLTHHHGCDTQNMRSAGAIGKGINISKRQRFRVGYFVIPTGHHVNSIGSDRFDLSQNAF